MHFQIWWYFANFAKIYRYWRTFQVLIFSISQQILIVETDEDFYVGNQTFLRFPTFSIKVERTFQNLISLANNLQKLNFFFYNLLIQFYESTR